MPPTSPKSAVVLDAIRRQVEIDRDLRAVGVRDLVGSYGELLAAKALSVKVEKPVTEGHDLLHASYGRVQVKTRKLPVKANGKVGTENRAVGFDSAKPAQFDWLFHIVLDPEYRVSGAVMAPHAEVWPEIMRCSEKIGFKTTRSTPSSVDMTSDVQAAATNLFENET